LPLQAGIGENAAIASTATAARYLTANPVSFGTAASGVTFY